MSREAAFIGHTRFSLFDPKSGSWRATRGIGGGLFETLEAYRNHLFSPERLKPRLDCFINLSLPNLALAKKDYRVRHIVSYSASAPEFMKEALAEAAEQYEFLVLDEQAEDAVRPPQAAVEQVANDFLAEEDVFGWYRLDDDDLLAFNYFSALAPFVQEWSVGMSLSPSVGLTAFLEDGRFSDFRYEHFPMNAQGLASVCGKNGAQFRIPKQVSHTRTDHDHPVILYGLEPLYLRSRHLDQDTSLDRNADTARAKLKKEAAGQPRFEATWQIADIFPALDGRYNRPDPIFQTAKHIDLGSLGLDVSGVRSDAFVEMTVESLSDASTGDVLMDLDFNDFTRGRAHPRIEGLFYTGSGNKYRKKLPVRQGTQKIRFPLKFPDGATLMSGSIFADNPQYLGRLLEVNIFGVR